MNVASGTDAISVKGDEGYATVGKQERSGERWSKRITRAGLSVLFREVMLLRMVPLAVITLCLGTRWR